MGNPVLEHLNGKMTFLSDNAHGALPSCISKGLSSSKRDMPWQFSKVKGDKNGEKKLKSINKLLNTSFYVYIKKIYSYHLMLVHYNINLITE